MVTILIPVGLTSERVYRANSQQADKSMAHIARPAIGPKQTWASAVHMSAFGGKADIALGSSHLALTREKKLKLGTRGRLFAVIGLEGGGGLV